MIFFTSDHHFDHANIIKYCKRPFASVPEMNERMVELWNETVRPDDIVCYLGDFSLSKKSVAEFLPRLNGAKHLVSGNHDHCHPCQKGWQKHIQYYLDCGFESIRANSGGIRIADHEVVLHHMPYLPAQDVENFDTRYKEYRPIDDGAWLLHGHVHEKWKVQGRCINVGVDVWDFKPVSIDEIAKIIQANP